MAEHLTLRSGMVERQLRARGIRDERVLSAMLRVPRHRFVPDNSESSAYLDSPLGIGHGQTISQPYMVAYMTEILDLSGTERVLEIGTGSGYQAAVLAELAAEVTSVERLAPLAVKARTVLTELGYDNVKVVDGDGTLGFEAAAPYDRIIVTAGSPRVPEALREQLALGGLLVIPVGDRWYQDLMRIERLEKGYRDQSMIGCVFVPLIGEQGWVFDR